MMQPFRTKVSWRNSRQIQIVYKDFPFQDKREYRLHLRSYSISQGFRRFFVFRGQEWIHTGRFNCIARRKPESKPFIAHDQETRSVVIRITIAISGDIQITKTVRVKYAIE